MSKYLLIAVASVVLSIQTNASTEWTKETQKKFDNLVQIGFPEEIAESLINNCKSTAKDPVNCIKIGASILGAESSKGTRCHNNNCVGMNDGSRSYSTKDEGIKHWVEKYNKWWYNQHTPLSFYRDDGVKPVTWYCLGKKKDGVCREGTKNSWKVFNSLNF